MAIGKKMHDTGIHASILQKETALTIADFDDQIPAHVNDVLCYMHTMTQKRNLLMIFMFTMIKDHPINKHHTSVAVLYLVFVRSANAFAYNMLLIFHRQQTLKLQQTQLVVLLEKSNYIF